VSDNVRKLEPVERKADDGVVAMLESLLAHAKAGRLISIVAAAEVIGQEPILARSTGDDANYYALAGALAALQFELRDWHEGQTDQKVTVY
jgi:predicted hydrolase (HD superfamily)